MQQTSHIIREVGKKEREEKGGGTGITLTSYL